MTSNKTLLILISILCSSCSGLPAFDKNVIPEHKTSELDAIAKARWGEWSPSYVKLLQSAYERSPKLAQYEAKVRQSEGARQVSGSVGIPSLSIQGVSSGSGDDKTGASTKINKGEAVVAWTPDIFGKAQADKDAKSALNKARRLELVHAQITLIADMAELAAEAAACSNQEGLLVEELESQRRSVHFMQAKSIEGSLIPAGDSTQVAALSSSQSTLESKRQECKTKIERIHELTGLERGTIKENISKDLLIIEPQWVPETLNGNVILSRMDVGAAAFSAEAQWFAAEAARKARWPSLSISGTIGSGVAVVNGIGAVTKPWTFAFTFAQKLYDAGALEGSQIEAEGKYQEALGVFTETAKKAGRELEEALSERLTQRERVNLLTEIVKRKEKLATIEKEKLHEGRSTKNDLEELSRDVSSAKRSLIDARLAKTKAWIEIYRMSGGLNNE